jgi:hypothetical protein
MGSYDYAWQIGVLVGLYGEARRKHRIVALWRQAQNLLTGRRTGVCIAGIVEDLRLAPAAGPRTK